MFLILAWFLGTLILPLLLRLDNLLGLPVGSVTVLSWIAVGISKASSENHITSQLAAGIKMKDAKGKESSDAEAILNILFWTLALIVSIVIIKKIF